MSSKSVNQKIWNQTLGDIGNEAFRQISLQIRSQVVDHFWVQVRDCIREEILLPIKEEIKENNEHR